MHSFLSGGSVRASLWKYMFSQSSEGNPTCKTKCTKKIEACRIIYILNYRGAIDLLLSLKMKVVKKWKAWKYYNNNTVCGLCLWRLTRTDSRPKLLAKPAPWQYRRLWVRWKTNILFLLLHYHLLNATFKYYKTIL